MSHLLKAVIQLMCLLVVNAENAQLSGKMKIVDLSGTSELDYWQRLVMGIRSERSFDTLLVMQRNCNRDQRIQLIYEMDVPKMFVSHSESFKYKNMFNSEVMVIVILESKRDIGLLALLAVMLDYMRQVRILFIAYNFEYTIEFQDNLLKACELHKMTNVIFHYIISEEPMNAAYHLLNPYPDYHFEAKSLSGDRNIYFPIPWRNMKNKTLVTMPDQALHSSILYKNSKGQHKLNGVAARLIMLFAEKFNASLQFLYPVKVGEVINVHVFSNFTKHGLVQLPMGFNVGFSLEEWARMTYPIMIGKWRIMIPCPRQLHVADVFLILVTKELFCIIVLTVVVFALVHAAIDLVAVGYMNLWDVILDEKMIRGTLGQSFSLKQHPLWALTLLYLLLFFLGLNMNVLIAANVKTLITAPPFQRGIETLDDLIHSQQKILFQKSFLRYRNQEFIESLKGSVVLTTDSVRYEQLLASLDSPFGFIIATMIWELLNMKQAYLNQKKVCIPPELTVYDLLFFSMTLEDHSPYKEPLDYLIHRIHQAGLTSAWQISSFLDMMTYKKLPMNYTTPMPEKRVLKVQDLKWIWFTLLVGLTSGSIVFLAELISKYFVA